MPIYFKNNKQNTNPSNTTRELKNKSTNTRHTNLKQKESYKRSKTHPSHLLLMLCGDIEPNLGPVPNLLQTHPSTHKNMSKMYFLPCTIKRQPEYQHLAKYFSPSINVTHTKHQDTTTKYPHLSKYIYQNQHHPLPRILYALITTINPILETCNHLLIQIPTPYLTKILLEQMILLQNPPEDTF